MDSPKMHITFEPQWWKVIDDGEPYYKTAYLSTGDDLQFKCPFRLESDIRYLWEDAPNDLKDKWNILTQLDYDESRLLYKCANRAAETTEHTVKTKNTYKLEGLVCTVSSERLLEDYLEDGGEIKLKNAQIHTLASRLDECECNLEHVRGKVVRQQETIKDLQSQLKEDEE